MKNIYKIVTLSLIVTLTSCINDDSYKTPDLSGECANLTVTKQPSFFTTAATSSYAQHTDEDIIEGYVTSSDEGGNFYKSISFVSVDGTVGFSVPIDDYNLYTKYEPGRKVYINMKNRYFVKENDATVIGSLYNNNTPSNPSDDEVGRISPVEYQSVLTRSCDNVSEETLVNTVTIAQAKTAQYLNKIVEINDVQFTDASVGKKYYDPTVNSVGGATNHLISETCGTNTLTVRVSEYATFASQTIPNKKGTIRGVMTKFGSTYQFMIRTLNDVKLNQDKPAPFLAEDFSTNFPNWVKQSVIGNQVWSLNSAAGNPGSCAEMNGYASGAQNNEDWFISPAVDLSTATCANLTFQTARPFNGTALQVLVSTNYAGTGAPSTATWTTLSATMATSDTWTNSGNISLSTYVGNPNVRIAFKYVSTTSGASQWRVDNVKIQ